MKPKNGSRDHTGSYFSYLFKNTSIPRSRDVMYKMPDLKGWQPFVGLRSCRCMRRVKAHVDEIVNIKIPAMKPLNPTYDGFRKYWRL